MRNVTNARVTTIVNAHYLFANEKIKRNERKKKRKSLSRRKSWNTR